MLPTVVLFLFSGEGAVELGSHCYGEEHLYIGVAFWNFFGEESSRAQ